MSIAAAPFQPALAHHSTAEFDYTKTVTIKGTVKEVQWTNPHSFIQVIVPGSGGQSVQWAVEIGSPSLNYRMGWKKDSLKPGDRVTMTLAQSRNGKPYATLRVATTADGRELLGSAANLGKVLDPATGRPYKSVSPPTAAKP
ncbi:MAG: DUF6152 family protein [Pseudomonadota bacterium]